MGCETYRDLFELHRDGALEGSEAAGARAHEAWCDACRSWEADTAAAVAPLAGFPPGPFLPPRGGGPRPFPAGGPILLGLAVLVAGTAGYLAIAGGSGPVAVETAGAGRDRPADASPAGPAGPEEAPGGDPSPPPPVPPDETATLTGRVVSAVDGSALPSLRVAVDGTPAAVTDGGGVFVLRGLPRGGARFLRIEGPRGAAREVLLPNLHAGTTHMLEDLSVGPTVPLAARVVDGEGNPVPGATVRALAIAREVHPYLPGGFHPRDGDPWARAPATAAGTDGIARFAALPPGRFALVARKTGWSRSRTVLLDLGPRGEDGGPPVLLLEPAFTITGRVLEETTAAPVAGAEIQAAAVADLRDWDDLLHHHRAVTDADGTFRMEEVPGVPFLLFARRVPGTDWGASATVDPVAVASAEFRLPPDATARGIAREAATGRPVPELALTVDIYGRGTRSGHQRRLVRSDADGRFEVRGVAEGSSLRVRPPPESPFVYAGPEDGTLVDSLPFPVPGEEGPWPEIDLPLVRAGAVEGVVRDFAGRPAGGALVVVYRQHAVVGVHPYRLVLADGQGRYRVQGLPPGPAYLAPHPTGTSPERISPPRESHAVLRGEIDSPARLDLEPGSEVPLDLALPEGPPEAMRFRGRAPATLLLRGSVASADGGLPRGLRLFRGPGSLVATGPDGSAVLWLRHQGSRVPVSADGSFEVEAAPGPGDGPEFEVALLALAPGYRPAVERVRGKAGDSPAAVRLVLERGAALVGVARAADGTPLPGVPLAAVPSTASGHPFADTPVAVTGPDGRFRIDGLGTEPHTLFLGFPGALLHRVSDLVPAGPAVEVRLPAIRDLQGRVTGRDGEPATGLPVTWAAQEGAAALRRVRTGAEGRFLFEDIPAVRFTLWLGDSTGAFDPGEFVHRVTDPFPADTLRVEEVLERARTVRGTVVGADGSPAPGILVAAGWAPGRSRSTRTDGRGAFELRGVPRGRLLVRAHGGASGMGEAWADPGEGTVPIRLAAGQGSTGEPASLEGRVVDEEGRTIARAKVRGAVFPSGDTRESAVVTGEEGEFRVPALRGLRYSLAAETKDGRTAYLDDVPGGAAGLVLRVGGVASGGIHGAVRHADGRPAAGVRVVAIRVPSAGREPAGVRFPPGTRPGSLTALLGVPVRHGRTNGDGTFGLGSPGGRWWVLAGLPGEGLVPRGPAVEVEADAAPLELTVVEGWTLRARLGVDDDAPPGSGARFEVPLAILPGEGRPRLALAVRPAPDGSVTVPGLPPGPADLVLRAPDGREAGRWTVAPMEEDDPPIEVR